VGDPGQLQAGSRRYENLFSLWRPVAPWRETGAV
jgi:hypothetical protein